MRRKRNCMVESERLRDGGIWFVWPPYWIQFSFIKCIFHLFFQIKGELLNCEQLNPTIIINLLVYLRVISSIWSHVIFCAWDSVVCIWCRIESEKNNDNKKKCPKNAALKSTTLIIKRWIKVKHATHSVESLQTKWELTTKYVVGQLSNHLSSPTEHFEFSVVVSIFFLFAFTSENVLIFHANVNNLQANTGPNGKNIIGIPPLQ